ncbi:MAG: DUF3422 domain-containing protein [Sphingomonadales bacterium]|nr:DUF3422 domain-containing protein [Sphingomonadales bacterium]MBD3774531.1 DUF3422 domain-containing protein [Paracoccaceae bacterium]
MREHELRRQVVGEMHLRRWPPVPVPGLILQWVTEVDAGERAEEIAQLDRYSHVTGEDAHPRHREGTLADGISFAWEKHSEGSSLAVFVPTANRDMLLAPREQGELADVLQWVDSMPGQIIRATAIYLVESDAQAEDIVPRLLLSRSELVSCHLQGKARMWSDFRVRDDGFGRMLVAANGTEQRDFTRLLQRLQELGNYRNKALLGLPVAQSVWPRLDAAEERLAVLSRRVADAAETDDALLAELSDLSLELMAVAASTNYRLSATAAYARLVEDRLEQLEISPIDGFSSLGDFTERRFLPAMRTCTAVAERERQLSLRASQLSSLLRARIDTRIENQNARLLRSMDHSSKMQLRLQHLVEGLSVVAVSYYLIGLVSYALKGMAHEVSWIDYELAVGLLVVPVVLAVWLGLRIAKRRVLGPDH